MASACSNISSSELTQVRTSNISSIKAFAKSNGASPIPSNYHSFIDIDYVADNLQNQTEPLLSLPIEHFPIPLKSISKQFFRQNIECLTCNIFVSIINTSSETTRIETTRIFLIFRSVRYTM